MKIAKYLLVNKIGVVVNDNDHCIINNWSKIRNCNYFLVFCKPNDKRRNWNLVKTI